MTRRSRLGSAAVLAVGFSVCASPLAAQTLFTLGETAILDFAGTMPGSAYAVPGAEEVYLHVSISERRLSVMRGGEPVYTFPVAVGKGAFLRHRDASNGGWLFETPSGVFTVGRKEPDPVWYAPDWYFIEKGEAIPSVESPDRYFPGEMGDYALYLGDGLAIHGTKDQDSVGQAVSHGCMRLSKIAVATVYPLVDVGTRVIITP